MYRPQVPFAMNRGFPNYPSMIPGQQIQQPAMKNIQVKEELNEIVFFKSSHYFEGNNIKILNIVPRFKQSPKKYDYLIYGSDGIKLSQSVNTEKNVTATKNIISFMVKKGETYFIKVDAYYQNSDSLSPPQEFVLFYKMEDDFEDVKPKDDIVIQKKEQTNTSDLAESAENTDDQEDNESTVTNVEDINEEDIARVFAEERIPDFREINEIKEQMIQMQLNRNSGLNLDNDES